MYQHLVHVFVMAPGHDKIVQTTFLSIHPILSVILRIAKVGVVLELVWKDDAVREFASHRESIPDHTPLRLSPESHHLAKIVKQSDKMEPIMLGPSLSDALGG